MKLHTILFLLVLVLQKEVVKSDSHSADASIEDTYFDYIDAEFSNEINSTKNIRNNSKDGEEKNESPNNSYFTFSANLYEKLKENQPQNFVLSPLSLRNILAMLSLGAMSETAEEIQQRIELPAETSDLVKSQSNLISSLKSISSPTFGLKFSTSDAIFANSKMRLKPQFKEHVTELGGDLERANFGNSEAAAGRINAWVHKKTEGKIQKIVEPTDLNEQTSLLLLNTIYFKGAWENQFNVSKTKKAQFLINGSCSVSVEMMYQQSEFQLADLDEAKAQVIILPYKGGRLSMMIYLPFEKEENSLDFLENWLKNKSPFDIQKEYLNENELSKVSVSLPKFKFRSSLQLNEPLKSLGLRKMFDSVTANFSGISNDSRSFFVSKVSQETFIEVNEEGTEAAAATGADLVATSTSPDFTANRPFLFQIVDSETETVLFTGRVKNPLETSSSSNSSGNSQCLEAPSLSIQDMDLKTERKDESSCVAKPEVEEMLLDFSSVLTNQPNETETETLLFDKYENQTTGLTGFLQSVKSTLEKLDKLKKLEEELKNKTQKIQELQEENEKLKKLKAKTPKPKVSGDDVKSCKPKETEGQGYCTCVAPAAARIYECKNYLCSGTSVTYNVTVHGHCHNFKKDVFSVQLTGNGPCVTLYKDKDCSGMKFRLETKNSGRGRDIRQQFPGQYTGWPKSPKSIGPCW